LKKFCDDINKKIPSTTFIHFADYAGFDAETFVISSDGKLKTIDDLYTVRKKYLEKEQIAL